MRNNRQNSGIEIPAMGEPIQARVRNVLGLAVLIASGVDVTSAY